MYEEKWTSIMRLSILCSSLTSLWIFGMFFNILTCVLPLIFSMKTLLDIWYKKIYIHRVMPSYDLSNMIELWISCHIQCIHIWSPEYYKDHGWNFYELLRHLEAKMSWDINHMHNLFRHDGTAYEIAKSF